MPRAKWMRDEDVKSESVAFRLTKATRARLVAAAAREGLPLGEWLHAVASRRADLVLTGFAAPDIPTAELVEVLSDLAAEQGDVLGAL